MHGQVHNYVNYWPEICHRQYTSNGLWHCMLLWWLAIQWQVRDMSGPSSSNLVCLLKVVFCCFYDIVHVQLHSQWQQPEAIELIEPLGIGLYQLPLEQPGISQRAREDLIMGEEPESRRWASRDESKMMWLCTGPISIYGMRWLLVPALPHHDIILIGVWHGLWCVMLVTGHLLMYNISIKWSTIMPTYHWHISYIVS